jgi:hypothetical protein
MIDASVAIPYLCASIFRPTYGRFSYANYQAIRSFQKLSSQTLISNYYINECASHLLRALKYNGLDRFSKELEYSENGYISYYYHLKNAGEALPNDIVEYLSIFSPACAKPTANLREWIRKIMPDIQSHLRDYKVNTENIISDQELNDYRKNIELEYCHRLNELKKSKTAGLIDHDVIVLAYLSKQIKEAGDHWVLLTWDKIMITLSKDYNCGWVVSPDVASDFVQPSLRLSDTQLCALAHSIARIHDRPLVVSAKIIDRVVMYSGEKIQDWKFIQELDRFKKTFLETIDFGDPSYDDAIERETDNFLREQGIDVGEVTKE